jgi:hypothetical protein
LNTTGLLVKIALNGLTKAPPPPQRTDVAFMLSNKLCDAGSALTSWLLVNCSGNYFLQNADVDHFHHKSSPLNQSVKLYNFTACSLDAF